MSDLAFHTTEEIIDELLHRRTFQGVIVRYNDDYRGQEWQGAKNFRVQWNANLSNSEVTCVIKAVSEALYHDEEKGEE